MSFFMRSCVELSSVCQILLRKKSIRELKADSAGRRSLDAECCKYVTEMILRLVTETNLYVSSVRLARFLAYVGFGSLLLSAQTN